MRDRANAILRQALGLPDDERAELAEKLIRSLEPPSMEHPAQTDAEWLKEIEHHARRVIRGESPGEPWELVRDRLARRLTRQ